jgi:CRP/FNR family cyclic AMP-dependent transcriptional regulator
MTDSPFDGRYLDALAAAGKVRAYPKHTLLIQEGDRSDQLYMVLSGRLKVFLSDSEGREIVIDTLGPRQFFGEMALEGEPRSASVMTTEPCRLAVIERDDFKRFLAENPDAAYALIVTLIRRARNLTRAVGSLALLDVYGRVARLLLDNAVEEEGRLVVGERLSQQEIARRVSASREMVSRIVTDLREGGYIGIEDDRMVIYRPLPKRW